MKTSAYIILAIAILLPLSCRQDFLDIKPQGQLTSENYFASTEQAIWAVNTIYAHIRQNALPLHFIGMTDIISDDTDKGSEPNDAIFLTALDNFTFDPGHPSVLEMWRAQYTGIARANLCIENLPIVPGITEAMKNRLLGEATFLRAYFYFNLVRWYGDVPLITKTLNPDEYNQSRTPKDQVYQQIITDLVAAITLLPERSQYAAADMGRATKGAARGILAKVYLTRRDYANAEKYALEVVNSGQYTLFPRYADIFLPVGEHSSESIFEIGCMAVESWEGRCEYNMVQGVRGIPNLGWGFNRPSDNLVAQYENGDPRREATVLYVGEVLPDGSGIVQDNPALINERYNQKAWVPAHVGLQDNGPGNQRLLRYADVILILAEALNEQGRAGDALVYLNQIRKRARGTNNFILPDVTVTDQRELRHRIWRERRVELALEHHRWFDVIRQLEVDQEYMLPRLKAIVPMFDRFDPMKHLLMPVPQTEIDLSGQAMSQNTGY